MQVKLFFFICTLISVDLWQNRDLDYRIPWVEWECLEKFINESWKLRSWTTYSVLLAYLSDTEYLLKTGYE